MEEIGPGGYAAPTNHNLRLTFVVRNIVVRNTLGRSDSD